MSQETTLETQQIYQGRVVNLRVDRVRLADGRITSREIVEHDDCVGIVALDDQGRVLLVRQYRKPVEDFLLEIPAGGVDPGEEPAAAAQRELREETGYAAGRMEPLGGCLSSPGYCTEFMHLYLATELRPAPATADAEESIEVVPVAVDDVLRLIDSSEIKDAKTIVALLLARLRLQRL